jgi:gluconolactonase
MWERRGELNAADPISSFLESAEPERLATGFMFAEGPLWHPDGHYYFVDLRQSKFYRLAPGREPELLRERTKGFNGSTFDLQGQIVICEGEGHRVCRIDANGRVVAAVAERFEGKRFNRPDDIICKSDGSLWFSDSGLRVPLDQREIASSSVYRIATDGSISRIADFECPNGLAFSPDERTLYVSNTMWSQYIEALELDANGAVTGRRRFIEMPSRGADGVPDGLKVDSEGRVLCAGPGGIWVLSPDGDQLGIIRTPEVCGNLTFGGRDLKTLFVAASRSVYSYRLRTPGLPHPWFKAR